MKVEMKPLSSVEAEKIIASSKQDGENKEIENFLKKFIKLDEKKAEKIEKELDALEIIKLKEEHKVKIIDLLPEDASDINKIFTDVSLDENEIDKILEVVKKNK